MPTDSNVAKHITYVIRNVCPNGLINYTISVTKMQVKKSQLSIKSAKQSTHLPTHRKQQ